MSVKNASNAQGALECQAGREDGPSEAQTQTSIRMRQGDKPDPALP